MQYQKSNEKTPVTPISVSQATVNQDYRQNSDIRRTRTIVLVLLGIKLFFAIAHFVQKCVSLGKYHNQGEKCRFGNLSTSAPFQHRSTFSAPQHLFNTSAPSGVICHLEPALTPLIGSVVAAAISVIYIIAFIFVVVKYKRIGILIFAWLGLLELILVLIVLVVAIIAVIGVSVVAKSAAVGIGLSAAIIVIAGIVFLLTILTVAFSFKLAKYIKIHQAYQLI